MKNIINKIGRTNIILLLVLVTVLFVGGVSTCYSYYNATGHVTSSKRIDVDGFAPIVNNDLSYSQGIDLESTITNNKNLAPGAEGSFDLNIDFSSVDYDSSYTISYNGSNIPDNLHFYSDNAYTLPLTTITGTKTKNNSERLSQVTIYWRWEKTNNSASNANDNLFMNQTITVPFTISISSQISN